MDRTDRLLLKAGMPAHVKGFAYTKVALEALKEDPTYIDCLTKGLYPLIAARFGTTAGGAERAIRHGVELAFDRMPQDLMEELFGNSVSAMRGKPTNGEFLSVMLLHLKGEGGPDKIGPQILAGEEEQGSGAEVR